MEEREEETDGNTIRDRRGHRGLRKKREVKKGTESKGG